MIKKDNYMFSYLYYCYILFVSQPVTLQKWQAKMYSLYKKSSKNIMRK